MPNSDNTYGTYNKSSLIFSQSEDTWATVFSTVDEAKAYLISSSAQTVLDECATTLQYGLVMDDSNRNTKLKVTFDFGTKGGSIAEADDWAEQFKSRWSTLQAQTNTPKSITGATQDASTDVITVTSAGHGFSVGDRIIIADVVGMPSLNATWIILSADSNTFTVMSGNTFTGETYSSGGTATKAGTGVSMHGTYDTSTDHLF